MNPFRQQIVDRLSGWLAAQGLPEESRQLAGWIEQPKDLSLGDFALPCFRLAKPLGKAPPVIARELAAAIGIPEDFAAVTPTGPYLNFRVRRDRYARWVLTQPLPGPCPPNGKTVVIDYSSPNIAKPFGVGHLRSTVIGAALARMYAAAGWKVVRLNHLGDWGTQFGKLMEAYRRWGEPVRLAAQPIHHLYELYARFHQEAAADGSLEDAGRAWFKRLEDGDPEARTLWQRFRALSLEDFQRLYARLGVEFDSFDGEAFYNDRLEETIGRLTKAGLARESEGALVVDLTSEGIEQPCLIRKSDGATLYATRDLAAAFHRADTYRFDRMIYVVGAAQQLHFRQIFAVLRRLGAPWADRCVHVAFGLIQGISTRKGTLVFLEDLLDEAIERIDEIVAVRNYDAATRERISRTLGIGAVVFNDLARGRIKDVEFDWERMLALEGDTGPYVQYAQVRAGSLLAKSGRSLPTEFDTGVFEREESAWALVQLLAASPGALESALAFDEPSTVTQQLLKLAQSFNKFYYECPVIGSLHESEFLVLTYKFKKIIEYYMQIIGLNALDIM